MYDLGGDPLSGAGAGAGFGQGFSFTDIMDAFFGQQASSRGPRPRTRRGQDALIRISLELAEAAFGVKRELKVDTAVVCTVCSGAGTSPGTAPTRCTTCQGQGEISHVQRSFLGEVRTMRPCPTCRGFGTVILNPCSECSGDGRVRARRAITVAIPAGVDNGTRVQLSGEGEVGPGGGPAGDLYVEIEVAATPGVHPPGRRPALHDHGAHDGGGAGHDRRAARPSRRISIARRASGLDRTDRARHPGRHPVGGAVRGPGPWRAQAARQRPRRRHRHRDRRDADPARRGAGRPAAPARRRCAARRSRRSTSRRGTRASSTGSRTRSAAAERVIDASTPRTSRTGRSEPR